ncbi:MAG: AAC(3) family N-acetyltransferase [Halalkalicoccus sp.]|nr:AAC(3) family N-acetyltransferase [Halalkalicoccus sp.]
MAFSRDELRAGFRGLGLEPESRVVVHSSLSSLGQVEGGAETVVDALLDAVGPDGTVAVPTFTRYDEPYDPAESPSTTGAVTDALWQRDDAVRSPHPTKSIAAIGPDADALVADHEPSNSLGPESPLHRLLERDGRILLLGVDHTANSALHVAERLANVPYRDQVAMAETRIDGAVESVEVNRVHCSRGFDVVRPLADHAGIVARGRIGKADARLLNGDALLSLVVELLAADPGALLCAVPDCDRCQYARERLDESA